MSYDYNMGPHTMTWTDRGLCLLGLYSEKNNQTAAHFLPYTKLKDIYIRTNFCLEDQDIQTDGNRKYVRVIEEGSSNGLRYAVIETKNEHYKELKGRKTICLDANDSLPEEVNGELRIYLKDLNPNEAAIKSKFKLEVEDILTENGKKYILVKDIEDSTAVIEKTGKKIYLNTGEFSALDGNKLYLKEAISSVNIEEGNENDGIRSSYQVDETTGDIHYNDIKLRKKMFLLTALTVCTGGLNHILPFAYHYLKTIAKVVTLAHILYDRSGNGLAQDIYDWYREVTKLAFSIVALAAVILTPALVSVGLVTKEAGRKLYTNSEKYIYGHSFYAACFYSTRMDWKRETVMVWELFKGFTWKQFKLVPLEEGEVDSKQLNEPAFETVITLGTLKATSVRVLAGQEGSMQELSLKGVSNHPFKELIGRDWEEALSNFASDYKNEMDSTSNKVFIKAASGNLYFKVPGKDKWIRASKKESVGYSHKPDGSEYYFTVVTPPQQITFVEL